MNVVKRYKFPNPKMQSKSKNELVKKDSSLGIRGATSSLAIKPFTLSKAILANNKAPRYQFRNDELSTASLNPSMGPPPPGPPKTWKRRILQSTSSKPESSSSGKARRRVLASDSAAVDTSNDFCTPKNRPTALRYISSSSRGHTGNRSAMSTSVSAAEPSVILAISEGRGMARGEIGMAAIDLKHPHLVLCQFSDTLLYTHTLTKIIYFNPIEIIVPHTFCEGVQPNQLYQLIKDQYPFLNITTVQRRHFSETAGRQHIQTLCAPQYSAVYLQVLQKFYAVTAAAAVLKYVEYIQCIVFARESLKIEYHSSENTMIIDMSTAMQLELVQPLVLSAGHTCCLLGVLGPTYTVGGIRALRAAILQPSCNKDFIESRLDAVQDLIENDSGLMVDIQDVIKKLSDIDKILFLCMETSNQNIDKIGEAQLNQTLLLKTTMDAVPNLVAALNNSVSGRLRKIKMDLENPNYNEITERIKNIIQDDARLEKGAMGSLQRCFAVRPEINGLLDVARRTYSELIEDIQKIVEQLGEMYDLPLRLNQNVMKGFHIVLPIAPKNRRTFNIEELPPIFIQVNNNGASVSMTTEELVVLNQQSKESLYEIQKMSNIVISSLIKELRPFMPSLYTLCENVAELDVLLAMAQASSVGSYIRPEFNSYLEVRNSVHPLLDYNSQVMPVPNDIFASSEYNFTIITGPNMGGKSIYIKQIALMQIMAQLGCFLPATNAVLRLCDRIFSRIGFNDSVELNASTYVLEMKEAQHILKDLTSSSLVIIDELCRGTCSEEGTSIAWAICEELIMSDAFTFFTTHFMYLTRLQELYFNVVNCHTAVLEEEGETKDSMKRLVYQHKIKPGITNIENYGLALAAKTNMPEDVVKLAMELAEVIGQNTRVQQTKTPQKSDEEILYKLNSKIRQEVRKRGNSDEVIRPILQKFKDEHPQLVERIKMQHSRSGNRTDSPTYYTSVHNSKQHTTSHNDAMNNLVTNYSNETNAEDNTAHDNRLSINLDTINENANRYDTNANYTSVRSSDQLLNSVLNNDQDIHEENEMRIGVDEVIMDDYNPDSINPEIPNQSDPNDDEGDNIFSSNTNNLRITENNNTEGNIDSAMAQDGIKVIDDTLSDSELMDELTQIVEQYSSRNESDEADSDVISVDESLISETINEIHEELLNGDAGVENIVLTPPIEFRDM